VFHLEVVKVDLDIAYVCKTSRAQEGWGVVETGMNGDDGAAGDRARWGWAAASDVRALFRYAATYALTLIIFLLRVSSDGWNHRLGAVSGHVLAPDVRALAVPIQQGTGKEVSCVVLAHRLS
jgi:hypothetical protein